MNPWLQALKITVSLIFLAYSSWKDYEKREVSNTVWMIFAPIGLFLSLLEALLMADLSFLIPLAISFIIVTGSSVALFHLDFFGGADAKALICLSITLPIYPNVLRPYLNLVLPIFSLSVLSNAVFTSSMLIFGIIMHNLSRYIKTGRRFFFEGLQNESPMRRFFLFITGTKVDLSRIKDSSHFIPLETFSRESDGKITRHLRLFPHVNEEEAKDLDSLRSLSKEINGRIWVTPSIPFLIFVTIGFIITLSVGDILIWLAFNLVS